MYEEWEDARSVSDVLDTSALIANPNYIAQY